MKTVTKFYYSVSVILIMLILSIQAIAQKNLEDSLADLSYEQFDKYFEKYSIDTSIDFKYAKAYLHKARKDQDTLRMANAFSELTNLYTDSLSLYYADSIIYYTKKKKYEVYPERGYLKKVRYYWVSGNDEKTLEYLFIAYDIAKKKNNELYQNIAKNNIAIYKHKMGNHREALKMFNEFIAFVENSEVDNRKHHLASGLLYKGEAYFFLEKYDSAEIVLKKGLELSLSIEDTYLYTNYLILLGVNLFKQEKYLQAIDSLNKGMEFFNDQINKMVANLYLGKAHYAIGDFKLAVEYFNTIDEFLETSSNINLDLLESYSYLIAYYKDIGDVEKQLYCTNKLLKFDSLYDRMHNNSIKLMNRKFNIPELVESKEELLKELKQKSGNSKKIMFILLFISGIAILTTVYFIIRNRIYKKRFKQIISEIPAKTNEIKEIKNDLEIDENIVNEILRKLKEFESSNKFLNKKLNLTVLSKELKTNSRYLSKIINEYKGCNFAKYLNNLRVEFAIKQLKEDKKFHAYTIKAIAEEFGFKTAQSFSLAFHKKTGIYPSYFMKQLQKL